MTVASARTIKTGAWCAVSVLVLTVMAVGVAGLNGDHVCMVQQKYNITKRVKYRAPMSVRTYEWCFSMPPRCSKWTTEMRDLTRLETEERTAEVAVCCPGYKMKDVSCVPVCPPGRTGNGCSEECPKTKWGPNCVNECKICTEHGSCSPLTGECRCRDGWQGERCEISRSTPSTVEELTYTKPITLPTSRTDYESTTFSTVGTTTTKALTSTTEAPTSTTKAPTSSTITILNTAKTIPTTTVTTTTEAVKVSTAAPTLPTTVPTAPKPTTTTTTPKSITTTTTVEPIATTLMTNVPTSTVETTLQSSKMATIEAKKPQVMQITTAKDFDWNNLTLTTPWTLSTYKYVVPIQQLLSTVSPVFITPVITTEPNIETITASTRATTARKTIPTTVLPVLTTEFAKNTEISTTTLKAKPNLITDSSLKEATRRPETTIKIYPTTIKFKPKEIWIRPAQKGELLVEKVKPNSEPPKHKSATKKDVTINTTPRTIIVSIIPTSLSYATFKKIALTTSSYFTNRNVTGKHSEETFTRSMYPSTSAPVKPSSTSTTVKPFQNTTVSKPQTPFTKESKSNATNSMSTIAIKQNSSYLTTIFSTNSTQRPWIYKIPSTKTYTLPFKPSTLTTMEKVTENPNYATVKRTDTIAVKAITNTVTKAVEKINDTKKITTVRPSTNTEEPEGEETFHILTEPEHITAVMGEKGTERSSVDLISVISIAGGVMMTVITVAVVIVMLERCKRPRFEDAKMNNIRMQVMIDNNDGPPPYVRSIFNTPLPDPPRTDKCHYQPISTLDRNLKQFMRPVVVQTISPMMLENFRGILECHYDHLPRRSVEFQALQSRCSVAPSLGDCDQLRQQRPDSLAESTIEALKCEAKLDVIDNTTSEPLYAEIPCWRPPSEHAIEIVNLNGEAVTEL